MIVYLAGIETYYSYFKRVPEDVYVLCTFFHYHTKKEIPEYAYSPRHILDSGAFSTFKDPIKARNFDWDNYVKRYIEFIKKTNQKLFFELDIDCVVGLEKVEYYRKMIEDSVGIAPIPVWHSNRKWEYFEMMCEEYPMVSLGTTSANADGKKIRSNPEILKKFINTAHKHNSKINGLGFTNIPWLKELKFDSVDSTSWISGQKFGIIHKWNGRDMVQYKRGDNQRMINPEKRLFHNFNEWVEFQKYAYENL